jgi:murein L,D-transpeptidase YafK
MKTAIFITCALVGASLLNNISPSRTNEPAKLTAYKVSKAKRASVVPVYPVRIIVDKSDYELHVYDSKGWFATYPVVFGTNTLADKRMEGDKCTPEGTFTIVSKRPHEKWCRMMLLNFPTSADVAKFKERKMRGEIPKNASLGGGIGIHGTWPHDDFMIDRYKNWTNGCISLKNEDIQELYSYIQVGTSITIKR